MRSVLSGPARERFDRSVLQSALDGRHLPPYIPGEPTELGAAIAAARVAPIVLDAIRDAHGVARWTPETFEDVFLGEAMRAWHGELVVERGDRDVVARTTTCPVLAKAQGDMRVCQACRAVRTLAAQEAYGEKLESLTFPHLVARGEAECEMRIETRA